MASVRMCSVDECERNAHARGYCGYHYRILVAKADDRPRCCVDECRKPAEAREMCQNHYAKWRRDTHRNEERCLVGACQGPLYARGLCGKHYSQARLYRVEPTELVVMLNDGCAVVGCLGTNLTIDHDHDCCATTPTCGNCNRGVLCNNHNLAIGHLHNSADEAQAVADYLRNQSKIWSVLHGDV